MEKVSDYFSRSWAYLVALFLTLGLLRTVEFFSIGGELSITGAQVGMGWFMDFLVSVAAIALFSVFQAVLFCFGIDFQKKVLVGWSLLLIVVNFVLIQYVAVTKIPLDESIYLFSIRELKLIVAGESRLSVIVLLLLVGVIVFYLIVLYGLLKFRWLSKFNRIQAVVFVLVLVFPSWTCIDVNNGFKEALHTNNRLAFFVQRSVFYFLHQDSHETTDVKLTDFAGIDPGFWGGSPMSTSYPLVHRLSDSSQFASFFKHSKNGPPNIVFLIVESLSTTLVGEKASKTGHLLPFLDSLSAKSLYWPNFLATCDRTNNVLPASLASVPYTTHGNMFQQIKFPNHWSLISLLNKHYFTRFYCGVDLNFANMNGYMNHYETDYLVKDWEAVFQKKYSHRATPWGFSDGSLFQKSWLDFSRQKLAKQPRMDVFLTISTHDPFVVPDEEKYIMHVKRAISKIKNPTATHRYVADHAREFASFVYVDEQLRSYFQQAKKQPGYENTVFFIFGDHGTELCLYDDLSRYKIPLLVYSPLLVKPQTFHAVSSQLDLAPTILNYLRVAYSEDLPQVVPFVGKELDYGVRYRNNRSLILGTNGLTEEHLFHANYFLCHDKLYRVSEGLAIRAVEDESVRRQLISQRKKANLVSDYTIFGNRIMPVVLFQKYGRVKALRVLYEFTKKQFTEAETKQGFVNLGSAITLDPKTKTIDVQIEFDYWNESVEKPTHLPRFTCSLENGDGEVLFWKQMDYESIQFKVNSWNKLSVSMELNLSDYKRLKKKNTFKYYILNPSSSKQPFKLRNLTTKIRAVD